MKRLICLAVGLALSFCPPCLADSLEASIARLNEVIAGLENPDDVAFLGDSGFSRQTLEGFRDELRIKAGLPVPKATTSPSKIPWSGGYVYYQFDASVNNAVDSAKKKKAFRDACAEWAMFGYLNFIEEKGSGGVGTYINVAESGITGGQAYVGMQSDGSPEAEGPAQIFNVGSRAWNRHNLCHLIGHALGLIHEHQRSDRDDNVTIHPDLLFDPNFIMLVSTQPAETPYDFLSIMHGAKGESGNPDDITPLPAYSAFANQMGRQFDRCLSKGDRDMIAAFYGEPFFPIGSVVTNTLDSGVGSLRAAMYYSIDHPGTTIIFNIPPSDPGQFGDHVAIDPSGTMTRPGPNTFINGGSSRIELTGATSTDPNIPTQFSDYGLTLTEANITVQGLAFRGFPLGGLRLSGPGATGILVRNCFFNVNHQGDAAHSDPQAYGLWIDSGANNNTIGGTTAADRNLFCAHTIGGIYLTGAGTSGNRVQGNYIGANVNGNGALPNLQSGVVMTNLANGNFLGADEPGGGNLISGNRGHGITVSGCDGGVIARNIIGLTADGIGQLGNNALSATPTDGVILEDSSGFTIARNLITFNEGPGVTLRNSEDCVLKGNKIGLNATDTQEEESNEIGGVQINGGSGHQVGGYTAADRNVISRNDGYGLSITNGASQVTVLGNYIGADSTGLVYRANLGDGVAISGAGSGIRIGSALAGGRNVISGNSFGDGISITGTNGVIVQGNYLGAGADGVTLLRNSVGVGIYGAALNQIGGYLPGEGNVIVTNIDDGVVIQGVGAENNVVAGNILGRNFLNTADLAETTIEVKDGARSNVIAQNVLNAWSAITVSDFEFCPNLITRNSYLQEGTSIEISPAATGGLQAPVLQSANQGATLSFPLALGGTISGRNYRIEIYGDGRKYYLGSNEFAGNNGTVNMLMSLSVGVPGGYRVSAIAIDTTADSLRGNSSAFSNTVVVAMADSDNDGLPDGYEYAMGLDVGPRNGPSDDFDGDGETNLSEFYGGSQPKNRNSVTRLAPNWNTALGLNQLTLTTPNTGGYRVDRATTLNGPWIPVISSQAGALVPVTLNDPGSANLPEAYYRLIVPR
jgi:parallel beta-helix repeat protein